jgi:hypothetical protein
MARRKRAEGHDISNLVASDSDDASESANETPDAVESLAIHAPAPDDGFDETCDNMSDFADASKHLEETLKQESDREECTEENHAAITTGSKKRKRCKDEVGACRSFKKRKIKECDLCGRKSNAIDPIKSNCYISWGRSEQDRIIEQVDDGAPDELLGKMDKYCKKTHEHVPEYSNLTVAQMKRINEHAKPRTDFEGWRAGIIEQMKNGSCSRANLVPVAQDVMKFTDAFTRRYRKGLAVDLATFQEMAKKQPELRKRSQVVEHTDVFGKVQQEVRLFTHGPGVKHFEEGEDDRVSHRTTLDDGTISLRPGQQKSSFNEACRMQFGSGAPPKDQLMISDLFGPQAASSSSGIERPSAFAIPLCKRAKKSDEESQPGSEDEEDDDDNDEEDIPPMARALVGSSASSKLARVPRFLKTHRPMHTIQLQMRLVNYLNSGR